MANPENKPATGSLATQTGVMLLPGNHIMVIRAPDGVDLAKILTDARAGLKDTQTFFVLPSTVKTEFI